MDKRRDPGDHIVEFAEEIKSVIEALKQQQQLEFEKGEKEFSEPKPFVRQVLETVRTRVLMLGIIIDINEPDKELTGKARLDWYVTEVTGILNSLADAAAVGDGVEPDSVRSLISAVNLMLDNRAPAEARDSMIKIKKGDRGEVNPAEEVYKSVWGKVSLLIQELVPQLKSVNLSALIVATEVNFGRDDPLAEVRSAIQKFIARVDIPLTDLIDARLQYRMRTQIADALREQCGAPVYAARAESRGKAELGYHDLVELHRLEGALAEARKKVERSKDVGPYLQTAEGDHAVIGLLMAGFADQVVLERDQFNRFQKWQERIAHGMAQQFGLKPEQVVAIIRELPGFLAQIRRTTPDQMKAPDDNMGLLNWDRFQGLIGWAMVEGMRDDLPPGDTFALDTYLAGVVEAFRQFKELAIGSKTIPEPKQKMLAQLFAWKSVSGMLVETMRDLSRGNDSRIQQYLKKPIKTVDAQS